MWFFVSVKNILISFKGGGKPHYVYFSWTTVQQVRMCLQRSLEFMCVRQCCGRRALGHAFPSQSTVNPLGCKAAQALHIAFSLAAVVVYLSLQMGVCEMWKWRVGMSLMILKKLTDCSDPGILPWLHYYLHFSGSSHSYIYFVFCIVNCFSGFCNFLLFELINGGRLYVKPTEYIWNNQTRVC